MKKIRAVIFDWSGIFCTPGELFSHPKLLKRLQMTPAEIEVIMKPIQDEYYRGKISGKTFWQKVFKRFTLKEFTIKQLTDAYLASYAISRRNLRIPLRLKRTYIVALLSNLTEEMMRHIVKTHVLKECFHHLFFSNRMGFLKPEYKIFRIALDKMGIRADEAVFIDDTKKNLVAAKKMGMRVLHCPSPDRLPDLLRRAKLL